MMTLFRYLRVGFTAALFLLILASASFAQSGGLTFTVNPAQQSGAAGSQVIFTGRITNNTGSDVDLNGISTNFPSPGFTLDPDVFDNNVPLFLANGEFTDGALFGLTIAPGTSSRIYVGTATLSANSSDFTSFFNLKQNIQVNVLPSGNAVAPEPGSGALAASALIFPLLNAAYRKRRISAGKQ